MTLHWPNAMPAHLCGFTFNHLSSTKEHSSRRVVLETHSPQFNAKSIGLGIKWLSVFDPLPLDFASSDLNSQDLCVFISKGQ